MAAIMENNECTNEEEPSQDGEWDAEPQRDVFYKEHRNPKQQHRSNRVSNLPNRPAHVRLLILRDEVFPLFG